MSYATGTTHYNLPQTVGTDKRDWTDTNEAFSAVDTALYGAVQDAETATSGIQTLNTAVDTINGKLATDEGNISTLSGKVSTLEGTVAGHTSAIADVRSDLQDNIESHKEASATSTHAYSIGDTFYYNDILYKATANIGVGDTIVPNTNCTGITVMSEISSVSSDVSTVSGDLTTLSNAVSAITPRTVATAAAGSGKTYGQQITELKTAFDALSLYEKARAVIKSDDSLLPNTATYGTFSESKANASGVAITTANMADGSLTIAGIVSGTETITDYTSSVASNDMLLIVA